MIKLTSTGTTNIEDNRDKINSGTSIFKFSMFGLTIFKRVRDHEVYNKVDKANKGLGFGSTRG